MQFDVPQFIESETRIVGSLTFRQVLYLAGAGIVVMVSYFTIGKKNPVAFTIITILMIIFSLSFAFLKIGGFSLNIFLKNFLAFVMSSRVYLWRKLERSPMVVQKKIEPIPEKKKEGTLRIGGASRINKLYTQIEVGSKE